MDTWHFIDPVKTPIATATGFGVFLALLVTRRFAWLHAITLFVVAEITSYYFAIPLADRMGWGMAAYAPIGCLMGIFALSFWAGLMVIIDKFKDNPLGTVGDIWRLWRGDRSEP